MEGARCDGRNTDKVHLAVSALPKESHCHCQAVGLQRMQEDVLLLYYYYYYYYYYYRHYCDMHVV
jgi:hypothetical protein